MGCILFQLSVQGHCWDCGICSLGLNLNPDRKLFSKPVQEPMLFIHNPPEVLSWMETQGGIPELPFTSSPAFPLHSHRQPVIPPERHVLRVRLPCRPLQVSHPGLVLTSPEFLFLLLENVSALLSLQHGPGCEVISWLICAEVFMAETGWNCSPPRSWSSFNTCPLEVGDFHQIVKPMSKIPYFKDSDLGEHGMSYILLKSPPQ